MSQSIFPYGNKAQEYVFNVSFRPIILKLGEAAHAETKKEYSLFKGNN